MSVSGTHQGGRYLVAIADRGPGMMAEQCASAAGFTKFEQSGHNHQGLGLGLAIARAAAESAGGRLLLEAAGPGRSGLKACLNFPAAAERGRQMSPNFIFPSSLIIDWFQGDPK